MEPHKISKVLNDSTESKIQELKEKKTNCGKWFIEWSAFTKQKDKD